jgi:phosphatidylethanolamine-binding protein
VNHHWIVNGDTLNSNWVTVLKSIVDSLSAFADNRLDNASANAVTPYAGPGPAEGSGPHRFVPVSLWAQITQLMDFFLNI